MNIVDQSILNFFSTHRVEWVSFFMLVVTYSAGYMVATIVTIMSAFSFYIHHHTRQIQTLFISVIGSALTVWLLKYFTDRARPIHEAFYLENSSSFPSGHSAIAVALYGFLFWVIWKHEKHHLKNPFIIFLSILILLIGLSRLYLGVHYFSDVIGGFAIGTIWILIALGVSKSKL